MLKPRTIPLLDEAINAGIRGGIRRTWKHREDEPPSDELEAALVENINQYIWVAIEERFYVQGDEQED